MVSRLFGTAVPCAAVFAYLERFVLPALLPSLYAPSALLGGAVSRAVGVPLLVTLVACFWLTMHGFSVGSARAKYMELARKDGEKDVDARYSLPNLYVEGGTKHARAFNAVQRSHQQAFETLPQLLFFTLVALAAFPLAAAANMALWLLGRVVWSRGYATSGGDAGRRYDHPLAYFIFAFFLAQFFIAVAAAGEMAGLWTVPAAAASASFSFF